MFLDAYFEHISEAVEAPQPALDAQVAPHGGLFQRDDWVYSALAPMPIAHLPVPPANGALPWVWVDFAFWDGERVKFEPVQLPAMTLFPSVLTIFDRPCRPGPMKSKRRPRNRSRHRTRRAGPR